jgi:hypothetical protein
VLAAQSGGVVALLDAAPSKDIVFTRPSATAWAPDIASSVESAQGSGTYLVL